MIAPDSYLWDLYPVPHTFGATRRHLTEKGWLTSDHKWNPQRIPREYFERRRKGFMEQEAYEPLTEIFNIILSCNPSNSNVIGMVNAGSHSLKSDRISTNRPDAYLVLQSSEVSKSVHRRV